MGSSMKKRQLDLDKDIISTLPEHLVEEILILVPIKQAIQTNVLSKKWKNKWKVIPALQFNDQLFPSFTENHHKKAVRIIDNVLSLHTGQVRRFSISLSCLRSCPSIDGWISIISIKGVIEFVLKLWQCGRHRIPDVFFTLECLSTLELQLCLITPPISFKGFSNLKMLSLEEIGIEDEALNQLIRNSPLLERLTLTDLEGPTELVIHAPNLQCFFLSSHFESLIFENTPILSCVSVTLVLKGRQYFPLVDTGILETFLSGLPLLKRFAVNGSFLQYLLSGDFLDKGTSRYDHLESILLPVNFEDTADITFAMCLLNCCPNLKELEIWVESDPSSMPENIEATWLYLNRMESNMQHVSKVKLINVTASSCQLYFIKYILIKSLELELLWIEASEEISFVQHFLLKEALVKLPHASQNVEIIYQGRKCVSV